VNWSVPGICKSFGQSRPISAATRNKWCQQRLSTAVNPFGLQQALALHASVRNQRGEKSFATGLLESLAITWRTGDRDLQNIPATGPAIIVANHPFGLLEGAVLATVVERARPDFRILANDLLSTIPELRSHIIPVKTSTQHGSRGNVGALRQALTFLEGGGCLIVFPAGEVSHFRPETRRVTDSAWHTAVSRIVELLSLKGSDIPLVPLYIDGRNSLLFQAAGLLHPVLRTLLLIRELFNKRGTVVEMRIGSPVRAARLLELPNSRARIDYLRWRTYILAERRDYKTENRRPIAASARLHPQPVAQPVSSLVIEREIAALPANACLSRTASLEVYLARAASIPETLREIGRLREMAFRDAGEGTGNARDLDRFDHTYFHLFAWNTGKREIAAAYRLAGTDEVSDLYTATLFRFRPAFLEQLGPALELGRSFVRIEYQRTFAPLFALWKGIGAYLAENPRYRRLFGPVSISNRYQTVSRELMISFLEARASATAWKHAVRHRDGCNCRRRRIPPSVDLQDLSEVIADLEPSAAGVPVLLRQYLKLGGKLLGFNVDPRFSNALDGLILVDLTETDTALRERYLGKTESARFMRYHHQSE
jgi:putative hemolysin